MLAVVALFLLLLLLLSLLNLPRLCRSFWRFLDGRPMVDCALSAISSVFGPIKVPAMFGSAAVVSAFLAGIGVAVERSSTFRAVIAFNFHSVGYGCFYAFELSVIVEVDVAAPEEAQQMAVVLAD